MTFATLSLHADEVLALYHSDQVAPPLSLTTTFRYSPPPGEAPVSHTEHPTPNQHVYSRISQPNRDRVETVIGNLEGGHAVTYASGLAAVFSALMHYLPKRVAMSNCYQGTIATIELFIKVRHVEKIDINDEFKKGDLVWLETPINPTGEIHDISAYALRASKAGAVLIVDGTFAPPPLQFPLMLGAHAVFHSVTKYFGGHSDLLGGVLIVPTESEAVVLRNDRTLLGNTMGNMETWLLLRSLRTLQIRVTKQSQTATELVGWLNQAAVASSENAVDGIPPNLVRTVFHSSIQDTPFNKKVQMPGGFGPVFSVLFTSARAAQLVAHRLKYFVHATSLGSVESLVEWRVLSNPGTDDRLLRVSVGLEDLEDLKEDWKTTLCSVAETIKAEI